MQVPEIQAPSWNDFSQHVDKLPSSQVNHLKELTRNHLHSRNDEKKARYIKVAYIDNYDGPPFYDAKGDKVLPRVVLWEEHPAVHGLDTSRDDQVTIIDDLKKSLRTQYLPAELGSLKTELYFASMQLRSQRVHSKPETLRHYLISYCDKVYAKPLLQPPNATWTIYKNYFNQAQQMILTKPALYTELCSKLKEFFSHPSSDAAISEDKLYSYLVLLRSLPDTVAWARDGHMEAAKSLKELLALLEILDDDKSALSQETIYNVVNAIEWLTYLIPRMYGASLISSANTTGQPLYEELVERMEQYISSDEYTLAIRMESAWALGWASVSSIAVASCVHKYDKSAKSRVYRLRSNVLRHVVGTAYLRASFTLVGFGPARISYGTVEPLPGSYLPDQVPNQLSFSTHDAARLAAANIVSSEIKQIVGGNIRFQLIVAVLTACWLVTNDVIAVLFSLSIASTILLAVTPILVLLILMIQITWEWGRGYWWRITVIWVLFALMTAIPWIHLVNWQQILIVVGAFIAFLTIILSSISAWITVLALFPTLARFWRFKDKP